MIETDCRKNRVLLTFSSNALVCTVMPFLSFIHHIEITPNYMILDALSVLNSIRKQLTFRDATISLPAKWRLINEHRKCIPMTRHYAELDNPFDWSCWVGNLLQPIRSTIYIWLGTRHHFSISALVTQTSFRVDTSTFCQHFNVVFYLSFSPFLSVLVGPPNRTWRYDCTIKVYCV